MKIALLGYGKQGRAAYDYWYSGNEITICDSSQDLDLPTTADSQLGPDYLQGLDRFDVIVRSPIIHPRDIAAANSHNILNKVTTVTNEFFKVCPSINIIGVTGTKGKGTTSSLIVKLLEAAGYRVHLGGNIGTPPLDLLKNDIRSNDWIVLELANFQLIDLKFSPPIAVCLMVTPEHLDWHKDINEYYDAKAQLFIHQKSVDIAIYLASDKISKSIASRGPGKLIPYFALPGAYVDNNNIKIDGQNICKTTDLKLLGKHNWQNVCAALTAVWQVTQDVDALSSALNNFHGLPYRLESRREVNGIRYYNDSFASGPPATIAAVEAIPGTKVMIIGGYDRNLKLDEFAKDLVRLKTGIRKVLLIGDSAQRTSKVLTKNGFDNFEMSKATEMAEIVSEASELAQTGDAVVLSPGFASFDMFKNFEDRGNQFNRAVSNL
ncbi:MAG TPA: UDP-N-acetylmuramoyl-L-alanine--D-glutamate ligase [Candidatus Saccharimonadales bacterium]|nr:UDP-N-acetylmuramoyl-L-alanine--D-glutamate ligase [Candidatus Saccharimonadales bacterium]